MIRESRFSLHVCCPRCGRTDLRKRRERDYVDPMMYNPLRYGQRLLGAALWHCEYCRIQFYDVRSRKKDPVPARQQPEMKRVVR